MIERLTLSPYRLALRRPWASARGAFAARTGWLVCAQADGLRGFGDCAPLPAAGTEDPDAALHALADWCSRVAGQPLAAVLDWLAADDSPTPAARCAVECAVLDLAARRAGVPLRRWLAPGAADAVEVNAALGALCDLAPDRLEAALAAGYRVLKVKVGLAPPEVERRRLTDLAAQLPAGVTLRLDANGAWSRDDAARMVDALNPLPVESLEEPLREPGIAALEQLQAAARFPLALDETLQRAAPGIALDDLPVRRVVLKPAAVGGLRRTLARAAAARGRGLEVVVTGVVETAAGTWPSLQLAAATASPLAHGLATAGWLAEDLGEPPAVAAGRIALPARSGSGFSPAGSLAIG